MDAIVVAWHHCIAGITHEKIEVKSNLEIKSGTCDNYNIIKNTEHSYNTMMWEPCTCTCTCRPSECHTASMEQHKRYHIWAILLSGLAK